MQSAKQTRLNNSALYGSLLISHLYIVAASLSVPSLSIIFSVCVSILSAGRPLTGRTHQIRLHLQRAGFPICNDPIYGGHLTPENKHRDLSTSLVSASTTSTPPFIKQ